MWYIYCKAVKVILSLSITSPFILTHSQLEINGNRVYSRRKQHIFGGDLDGQFILTNVTHRMTGLGKLAPGTKLHW